jgi:hypothetical protein
MHLIYPSLLLGEVTPHCDIDHQLTLSSRSCTTTVHHSCCTTHRILLIGLPGSSKRFPPSLPSGGITLIFLAADSFRKHGAGETGPPGRFDASLAGSARLGRSQSWVGSEPFYSARHSDTMPCRPSTCAQLLQKTFFSSIIPPLSVF